MEESILLNNYKSKLIYPNTTVLHQYWEETSHVKITDVKTKPSLKINTKYIGEYVASFHSHWKDCTFSNMFLNVYLKCVVEIVLNGLLMDLEIRERNIIRKILFTNLFMRLWENGDIIIRKIGTLYE